MTDTQTYKHRYVSDEKTRKSNHLQMLEQSQLLLLNYFKPRLSVIILEPEPPVQQNENGTFPIRLITRRYTYKAFAWKDIKNNSAVLYRRLHTTSPRCLVNTTRRTFTFIFVFSNCSVKSNMLL